MSSTKLQGRKRESNWKRRIPSQPSMQAPGEPGSANRNVPFATPPVARDWMVEVPLFS